MSPAKERRINDQFLQTVATAWLAPTGYSGSVKIGRRLQDKIVDTILGENTEPVYGELQEFLANTKNVDSLLFLTQKRHRDHTLHQLKVLITGYFLMQGLVDSGNRLKDEIRNRLQTKYTEISDPAVPISDNDVLTTWMITALLHDSGFPLAHLNQSILLLAEEGKKTVADHLDMVDVILKNYGTLYVGWDQHFSKIRDTSLTTTKMIDICCESLHDTFEEFFKFMPSRHDGSTGSTFGILYDYLSAAKKSKREMRKKIAFDHGVWSAANTIHWLLANERRRKAYESHITHLMPVFNEALDAVAFHNLFSYRREKLKPHNYKLEFASFPISALLILCDEIHEWHRLTTYGDVSTGQETRDVILGPLITEGGNWRLQPTLEIVFNMNGYKELEKTGWDFEKFCKSKAVLGAISFSPLESPKRIVPLIRTPITARGSEEEL